MKEVCIGRNNMQQLMTYSKNFKGQFLIQKNLLWKKCSMNQCYEIVDNQQQTPNKGCSKENL